MSSVFFFKDVGEHSDDNKEGFKKYPLISSLLSAKVLTVVVSVVSRLMRRWTFKVISL